MISISKTILLFLQDAISQVARYFAQDPEVQNVVVGVLISVQIALFISKQVYFKITHSASAQTAEPKTISGEVCFQ